MGVRRAPQTFHQSMHKKITTINGEPERCQIITSPLHALEVPGQPLPMAPPQLSPPQVEGAYNSGESFRTCCLAELPALAGVSTPMRIAATLDFFRILSSPSGHK